MGLFTTLAAPLKGYRLLRRLLAEQRAQRHALERIADALELGTMARETVAGQVFRSYSQTKGELSEQDLREVSGVSYVDDADLARMQEVEAEVTALKGRAPTEVELERAFRGDVE